ncbi:hypothetical protein TWF696_003518 [Orbilia brochopaga]|uniref:BTB domain-containing protein n=1 Tax=Orbilia brochopaga TaxID=3140254 RepID=A0AAV9TXL6_9PEZI
MSSPGTASPGAKRQRTDCNRGDGKTFIELLNSGAMSDIIVTVGPEKDFFELHKNIITLQSNLLETLCSEGSKKPGTTELILPQVDGHTFRIILEWMYDGKRALRQLDNDEKFLTIYKAADFLDMPQLKIDIIGLLSHMIAIDFKQQNDPGYVRIVASPKELVRKIGSSSHLRDWEALKPLFGVMVKEYTTSPKDEFKDGDPNGKELMLALAIDALEEERLARARCTSCILCPDHYQRPKEKT